MGIFLPSYSRNYSRPRYPKRTKYPPKVSFMFKAEDVWSAAAAAQRINGRYLKEPLFTANIDDNGMQTMVQTHEASKVLVRKMLDAGKGWTDEDVAQGADARTYWQAQLMKIVGGTASDFDQTAINAANKEEITSNFDLAVISSLVASAQRGKAKEAVDDAKMSTDSKHQGTIGEKFELTNAEILAVGGLSDFGKYRVDAKCEGNLYTWWSSKTYKPGDWVSIKGKVKGHIKDRGTNVAVTQLNYVKEV